MPPITVVSPFFTTSSVVASFLLIGGGVPLPTELLDALIFIETLPSDVMCGVTSRVRAASTNSVLVPSADTVWYGTDWPCEILAALLLTVSTFGVEMIFTWPMVAAADSRRSNCTLLVSLPNDMPVAMPPVVSVGSTVETTPPRDVSTELRLAKLADPSRYDSPHCTPISRVKLEEASTIRASIITCFSGTSSDSRSALIFLMTGSTSTTITLLVRASEETDTSLRYGEDDMALNCFSTSEMLAKL